jgi:hypothetical protein
MSVEEVEAINVKERGHPPLWAPWGEDENVLLIVEVAPGSKVRIRFHQDDRKSSAPRHRWVGR